MRRALAASRASGDLAPDGLAARRRLRGPWIIAVLALAGGGVALAEGGAPHELIRADALAVAALVAYAAVRRLAPPARRRARRGPPASALPPRLERLERRVALGVGSAVDLHTGVRPVLREIAGERLARRGIALDADPDAPVLLGDELWEIVRPDRPVPDRVDPHGLPLRALRRHLDTLERL
jgi:hypothetical protein